MPWVGFATKAAWQTFHDAACADLGIPRPGKRQSDGQVQLDAQWTDAAFAPTIVNAIINGTPRKVAVMFVPPAAVNRYNLAGNVLSDPTVIRDANGMPTGVQVTYQGTDYLLQPVDGTAFPFRKPKPATWTDPDTGTVYPVT